MVRAKFRVHAIERTMGSKRDGDKWVPAEVTTIKASPVYSDDPESENGKFWAASPSGEFVLGCVNPAAVAELKLDHEYYIDISPAPASKE